MEWRTRDSFGMCAIRDILAACFIFLTLFGLPSKHIHAQTPQQLDWFCPTAGWDIWGIRTLLRFEQKDEEHDSPQPFENLTEPQQNYLNEVLAIWQRRSNASRAKDYHFTHESFDGTTHPNASTRALGYLSFTPPNKWLYRIDTLNYFSGFDKARIPRYVESPRASGRSLFYFDGESLKVLDRDKRRCLKIPVGEKIAASSLAQTQFPFAIDSAALNSRFWIRPIASPPNDSGVGESKVWIEFWPRQSSDKGSFSRLQVAIDCQTVIPKQMTIFHPGWRPENQVREVYKFSDDSQFE